MVGRKWDARQQVFENSMQLDDREPTAVPQGAGVFVTYLGFIALRA